MLSAAKKATYLLPPDLIDTKPGIVSVVDTAAVFTLDVSDDTKLSMVAASGMTAQQKADVTAAIEGHHPLSAQSMKVSVGCSGGWMQTSR